MLTNPLEPLSENMEPLAFLLQGGDAYFMGYIPRRCPYSKFPENVRCRDVSTYVGESVQHYFWMRGWLAARSFKTVYKDNVTAHQHFTTTANIWRDEL